MLFFPANNKFRKSVSYSRSSKIHKKLQLSDTKKPCPYPNSQNLTDSKKENFRYFTVMVYNQLNKYT